MRIGVSRRNLRSLVLSVVKCSHFTTILLLGQKKSISCSEQVVVWSLLLPFSSSNNKRRRWERITGIKIRNPWTSLLSRPRSDPIPAHINIDAEVYSIFTNFLSRLDPTTRPYTCACEGEVTWKYMDVCVYICVCVCTREGYGKENRRRRRRMQAMGMHEEGRAMRSNENRRGKDGIERVFDFRLTPRFTLFGLLPLNPEYPARKDPSNGRRCFSGLRTARSAVRRVIRSRRLRSTQRRHLLGLDTHANCIQRRRTNAP